MMFMYRVVIVNIFDFIVQVLLMGSFRCSIFLIIVCCGCFSLCSSEYLVQVGCRWIYRVSSSGMQFMMRVVIRLILVRFRCGRLNRFFMKEQLRVRLVSVLSMLIVIIGLVWLMVLVKLCRIMKVMQLGRVNVRLWRNCMVLFIVCGVWLKIRSSGCRFYSSRLVVRVSVVLIQSLE